MSNPEFQEWKHHQITKLVLSSVEKAIKEMDSSVNYQSTIEEIAIQSIRNEAFKEGLNSLATFIDDSEFNDED